jgi:hypothetical protein
MGYEPGRRVRKHVFGRTRAEVVEKLKPLLKARDEQRPGLLDALPPGISPDTRPRSAAIEAYASSLKHFAWVNSDIQMKFGEFREKWRLRLHEAVLQPLLQRNGWMQPNPQGGFSLPGKGTQKEARMLYLQSLHDMASDAERQVAGFAGRIQALQKDLAGIWHQGALTDNAARLMAAIEIAFRQGEADTFKTLRLAIGDYAQKVFIRRMGKWEGTVYPTPSTWFHSLALPWARPSLYSNGFIGFMEGLSRYAEGISLVMADHYARKWRHFLAGMAQADTLPQTALPTVPEAEPSL